MNKRQKKKLIPKNTEYCYTLNGRDSNGNVNISPCPHFKYLGEQDDAFIDSQGNHHPCKTPVYYCIYMKVSSNEDFILSDQVKCCGEKLTRIEDI